MLPTDHQRFDGLHQAGLNLAVECGLCGNCGVLDGPKLWRVFAIRRWPSEIDRVKDHLRCSVCCDQLARLAPTSDAPTLDPFPKDDGGWKRMVKRARDELRESFGARRPLPGAFQGQTEGAAGLFGD